MGLGNKLLETIKYFVDQGVDVSRVDEKEKNMRLALCENCDEFIKETRQCSICECFMDVKTALLYDPVETLKSAEQKLSQCPKGLW